MRSPEYSLSHPEALFLGGQWIKSTGADFLDLVCPSDEQVVARIPAATTLDIDRAVAAARDAFDNGPWPSTTGAQRAGLLRKLAELLRERQQETAWVTTLEMGTPYQQALMMSGFAIGLYEYYADLISTFAFEEVRPRTDDGFGVVAREPVGVAALIVPWNSPPITAAMKVAPALAAGCMVILKVPPQTPLDAYILAECIDKAGFPPGVFSLIVADREVSDALVRHPGVDKISFTGSTAVGRHILAVSAPRIARVTLELGGKSAAIMLDDVEPAEVIPHLVKELISNCGQACSSWTRMIVPRRRMHDYAQALAEAARAFPIGDPFESTTMIGPLAMRRQLDRVRGYIAKGREEGATLVCGGGTPKGFERGYFIEPTVFADDDNRMAIAQEEIFGPVSSIIPHDGPIDAIRIANDSIYGLHGSVYARELDQAYRIARRLRTGQVGCNSRRIVDVSLPMGGFKQSGIGRERGLEGLFPYLESKTLYVDRPPTLLGR